HAMHPNPLQLVANVRLKWTRRACEFHPSTLDLDLFTRHQNLLSWFRNPAVWGEHAVAQTAERAKKLEQ
ncbi:MAG: hypothetical protein E6813_17285, partial [Bradyrhizobium sp.]|uniref:hypothetical protein n=1 Tax=Bradyrhizobium sp. TaxID=376 RepID=UPI0028FEC37D